MSLSAFATFDEHIHFIAWILMSSVIHFIQFMSIVLLLTRIKKHGHTPFCSFICSDDRVRTDDSKKIQIQATITLKAIHCFSFHLRNGSYSLSLSSSPLAPCRLFSILTLLLAFSLSNEEMICRALNFPHFSTAFFLF